ncbi:MAG TPA: hypothetical protein VFU69_05195, partial [Ktedonobacterales bacterium]|nr:hypothetical protein [Ktedonobacterales bacterium]
AFLRAWWNVWRGRKTPRQEGKKLGAEIIQSLAEIEGVAGIHMMTIAWEDAMPEVLAEVDPH